MACPQFLGDIDHSTGWSSFGGTSDYFNSCNTVGLGTPFNNIGYQAPYSGVAYAGLIQYAANQSNLREYIGTQLLQPLIPFQKYFISFYISLADTFGFNCPSNNMGIKFSTIPFSMSSPPLLTNSAHVYSNVITSDKVNWTPVYGSFVADSSYQFLMMGNFFDDAHTDSSNCSYMSYYYIDQICVSTDSLICAVPTSINEINHDEFLNIFPESGTNYTITYSSNIKVNAVEVTDLLGQKISAIITYGRNEITVVLPQIANGVYIFNIYSAKGITSKKFCPRRVSPFRGLCALKMQMI